MRAENSLFVTVNSKWSSKHNTFSNATLIEALNVTEWNVCLQQNIQLNHART